MFVGGGAVVAVKCWGASNSHSRKKAAIKGAAKEPHLRGRRSCIKAAKELQMTVALRFIRSATKKAANVDAAQQKFDFKSQILSRKLQQKQKKF